MVFFGSMDVCPYSQEGTWIQSTTLANVPLWQMIWDRGQQSSWRRCYQSAGSLCSKQEVMHYPIFLCWLFSFPLPWKCATRNENNKHVPFHHRYHPWPSRHFLWPPLARGAFLLALIYFLSSKLFLSTPLVTSLFLCQRQDCSTVGSEYTVATAQPKTS